MLRCSYVVGLVIKILFLKYLQFMLTFKTSDSLYAISISISISIYFLSAVYVLFAPRLRHML